MEHVKIEAASINDAAEISCLYGQGGQYDDASLSFVSQCIETYPSAIARTQDTLVGFAYTKRFAPDILEIENIYVAASYRNKTVGHALLQLIESEASNHYKGLIPINSSLYVRPATAFYIKNGYSLVFQTGDSNVFAKNLV